jgi:hypothetical protein
MERPLEGIVARWDTDVYTQGAWSLILKDGSVQDRQILGGPVSPAFYVRISQCCVVTMSALNTAYPLHACRLPEKPCTPNTP